MRIALFSILAVLLSFAPVQAEIVNCGIPDTAILDTTVTQDYCDIYQRRFDYRLEDAAFKHLLQERQRNFNADRKAIIQNYKANLEALNNTRGSQNSIYPKIQP